MASTETRKRKHSPSSFEMYIKTSTGKVVEMIVEGSSQTAAKRGSRLPQGADRQHLTALSDITPEHILGRAQGAARNALAAALAEFWSGDLGKGVYTYLLHKRQMAPGVYTYLLHKRQMASTIRAEDGQHSRTPPVLEALKNAEKGAILEFTTDVVLDSILEFSRFFLLKAARMDCEVPYELSPSYEVDEVWHALLMFPRAYAELCKALLGEDGLIDHDPRKDGAYNERYRSTFQLYTKSFRITPNPFWWPHPEDEQDDKPERHGFTVHDLKQEFERMEGVPADQQRLVFAGKQLEDSRTLEEYLIGPGSIVHMLLRLKGC